MLEPPWLHWQLKHMAGQQELLENKCLFFITALAVFDALFVLTNVISLGLVEVLKHNWDFSNAMKGASENYLDQLSSIFYTCSVYCTILLSVVRYIAICQTAKVDLVKKSKIQIYLACILLFSIIWNIPKWTETKHNHAYKNYLTWGTFVILYLIPLTLLIVFNVFMVRKVSKE